MFVLTHGVNTTDTLMPCGQQEQHKKNMCNNIINLKSNLKLHSAECGWRQPRVKTDRNQAKWCEWERVEKTTKNGKKADRRQKKS